MTEFGSFSNSANSLIKLTIDLESEILATRIIKLFNEFFFSKIVIYVNENEEYKLYFKIVTKCYKTIILKIVGL